MHWKVISGVVEALNNHKSLINEAITALKGELTVPYGPPAIPPTPDTPVDTAYKPSKGVRDSTPTPEVRRSERPGRGQNPNVGRQPQILVAPEQRSKSQGKKSEEGREGAAGNRAGRDTTQ